MSADPDKIWQNPEWLRYVKHVREEVIPNLENSKIFVSLTPGSKEKVDIKFALELGLAIMYNKPIIAVIAPGQQVSEKFTKVVDKFVELDHNDPSQRERLIDALKEMIDGEIS